MANCHDPAEIRPQGQQRVRLRAAPGTIISSTAGCRRTGVKRVPDGSAGGQPVRVGSSVIIGDKGIGTSAGSRALPACMFSAKTKRIASITDVTIGGTALQARLNIETDNRALTPKRASPTSPRCPIGAGWNDTAGVGDGSRYSPISGGTGPYPAHGVPKWFRI